MNKMIFTNAISVQSLCESEKAHKNIQAAEHAVANLESELAYLLRMLKSGSHWASEVYDCHIKLAEARFILDCAKL
jgi:hypothetical protein